MAITEDGKYRAKAKGWCIGEASTGTHQVAVTFDLLDHPGESLTWYGFLSDKAFARTIESLRHMGWEGCDLTELADPATKLDKEVTLVVQMDTYNGQTKAKVQFVNKGGGPMKKVAKGDELKAFAAQMKAKILALDPSNAAKYAAKKPTNGAASETQEPAPGEVQNPDIPF